MKKIALSIFALIICLASTAFAAKNETKQEVAVVIVGSSDFKTANFIRYAREFFEDATKGTGTSIVSGDAVQSKYQEYWLDKGLLEEGEPTKDDLLNFVSYSGYDKVIYMIVKDPVTDKHRVGSPLFGTQKSRSSITVNAYLVDSSKILKTATSTKEDDSTMSELRAKRGAFKQCAREISKTLSPALK